MFLNFKLNSAEVAQLVEQLICNQQVGGSTPFFGSAGQMAERLKATDCKSVHVSVRRFEPYSAHSSFKGVRSYKVSITGKF